MADAEMYERITKLGVEAGRLADFAEALPLDDSRVSPAAILAVNKRLEQMTLLLADLAAGLGNDTRDILSKMERMELNTQQTEINTRKN